MNLGDKNHFYYIGFFVIRKSFFGHNPSVHRTRGTHTQKPSSHLNTHGKWHLHTSHLRQIHHCLNPHTQIPAHPLSLGVSWYLANCFQEIVGNRMIGGERRRKSSEKRGPEGPVREAAAEEKEEEEKEEGGGEDE